MESTSNLIKDKYGLTARSGLSSNLEGVQAVAQAFGYSAQELASIPAEANMGLSCGNPIATANLSKGEVVVDLGCGGGLDVFLAANKIGPSGKAIGIDMTPEMLELARTNARAGGYQNVIFLEGQIDDLPLETELADIVISNCVINLAPDKNKVFQEVYRVLKPGGRIAISDIALKQELPPELAQSVAALVGCIAGAISIADYEQGLKSAGFSEVVIVDSGSDLNAYAKLEGAVGCCSPFTPPVAASQSSCCSSGGSGSRAESSCCSSGGSGSKAESSCCSSGGSGCSDNSGCSCAITLAPPDPLNAASGSKVSSAPVAPSKPAKAVSSRSEPAKVSLVTYLPPLKNLENAAMLTSSCCSSSANKAISNTEPPLSSKTEAESLTEELAKLAAKYDLNTYAASIKIYAVK